MKTKCSFKSTIEHLHNKIQSQLQTVIIKSELKYFYDIESRFEFIAESLLPKWWDNLDRLDIQVWMHKSRSDKEGREDSQGKYHI